MKDYATHILKLVPNKVPRYPGGREIDRFRGILGSDDDGKPEAWVGSTVKVRNLREGWPEDMGLAKAILPDGSVRYVSDLYEEEPLGMLGQAHLDEWGSKAALLVKLLDAQIQLGLQSHPTREYAKSNFDSDFGKEESWYILSTRDDCEVRPYVLLGFKEGITRQDFERYYYNDDISALEGLCHKVYVEPGDMFIVKAGVPHAVGNGCFMVEIQEASDITVGARPNLRLPVDERAAYDERLLGCYIYDGANYEDNLKKYKVEQYKDNVEDGGSSKQLLGRGYTDCFSAVELDVTSKYLYHNNNAYKVGIITMGQGKLTYDSCDMDIKKGDEILIPANIENIECIGEFKLILCDPPKSK